MLLLMATFPFVEFTLVEGFLVHSPCGNPPIFTPVSRGLSIHESLDSSGQISVEISIGSFLLMIDKRDRIVIVEKSKRIRY